MGVGIAPMQGIQIVWSVCGILVCIEDWISLQLCAMPNSLQVDCELVTAYHLNAFISLIP
jgi:hypothetical protein